MIIKAIGPSIVRLEVERKGEINLECIRLEVTDFVQSKFIYLNKAQAKMLSIELIKLVRVMNGE